MGPFIFYMNATDQPPAVLEVVARAWADERAVEAQAVGEDTIGSRSGPIVPVGITIVDRRITHVPGIDEISWIGS